MDERLRFVARLLDGEAMSEVCREFGISRKTGYKIFDRYKEHGLEALSDRSRRPVRYANQLPPQIESLIVTLKREKPHWGARKIRELLVRRLRRRYPGPRQEHHPRRSPPPRPGQGDPAGPAIGPPARRCRPGLAPNDLWCADFKGEFKLGNGQYCYPLTVTDHASRYPSPLRSARIDARGPRHHRLRAALPGARPAAGHPLRQRRPLRQPECPVQPLQALRLVAPARHRTSSASSPAIRSRTAATSACTSLSRRKPPARPA